MQPVSPVLTEEFVSSEIRIAEHQDEYQTLPALSLTDGSTISRWRPTDEERAAIAQGADILLYVLNGSDKLQPVKVEIIDGDPRTEAVQ